MDETEAKLIKVFREVFPHLPEEAIPTATQSSVPGWESVAGLELMNVIEETFAIVVDFDLAGSLNSFPKILAYLRERSH